MTRLCVLGFAVGCGGPVDEGDPVLVVDPTGVWHVDRVVISVFDGTTPYTSTVTLPYGTGTEVEDMFLEFEADGTLLATDEGYTDELAWRATGDYTLAVTGDIDWDSWTCTMSDTDDDALTCLLADPDAELFLEATR